MPTEEDQPIERVKRHEALRGQVRTAINNPIPSLEYLGGFWAGRDEPPENRILLTGLTFQE